MVWAFLTLLLTLCFSKIADTDKEMLLVIEVVRHGARSPYDVNDDFTAGIHWKTGPSELTPSGERQHYLLGQYL